MPWNAVAVESALMVFEQMPDTTDHLRFIGMAREVSIELGQEILASHTGSLAKLSRSADPDEPDDPDDQKDRPKPAEKLKPSSENPKSARNRAARSMVTRPLTP